MASFTVLFSSFVLHSSSFMCCVVLSCFDVSFSPRPLSITAITTTMLAGRVLVVFLGGSSCTFHDYWVVLMASLLAPLLFWTVTMSVLYSFSFPAPYTVHIRLPRTSRSDGHSAPLPFPHRRSSSLYFRTLPSTRPSVHPSIDPTPDSTILDYLPIHSVLRLLSAVYCH